MDLAPVRKTQVVAPHRTLPLPSLNSTQTHLPTHFSTCGSTSELVSVVGSRSNLALLRCGNVCFPGMPLAFARCFPLDFQTCSTSPGGAGMCAIGLAPPPRSLALPTDSDQKVWKGSSQGCQFRIYSSWGGGCSRVEEWLFCMPKSLGANCDRRPVLLRPRSLSKAVQTTRHLAACLVRPHFLIAVPVSAHFIPGLQ